MKWYLIESANRKLEHKKRIKDLLTIKKEIVNFFGPFRTDNSELKADNSEVFKAINNLCTSIGNLPTISQFNDLNEEKVSKSEIIYYLKAKPSFEEIENLLEEKINKVRPRLKIINDFEEIKANKEIIEL